MQCPKCKRTWQTMPGEEQDHDCPSCGPIMLDLEDVETRPAEMTDFWVDVAREVKAFPCEYNAGYDAAKQDREYYGRSYR